MKAIWNNQVIAESNGYEIAAAERNQIRKDLEKMFKTLNLRTLYSRSSMPGWTDRKC